MAMATVKNQFMVGNIPYNPVSVMNSSLADMLNESSISEMLISIQQVRLTLTDIESVDVDEMDRSALSELCTTSESVANIINELLAEDASLSALIQKMYVITLCFQAHTEYLLFSV